MSDLKSLGMSELIALHNKLAEQLGVATENTFKDLKSARAAVQNLEKKMDQANGQEPTGTEQTSEAAADATTSTAASAGAPVASDEDRSKYNSSGKRGPNQGVGAYAKELIVAGKNNADVLSAVLARFPDAKTTVGCIAFYRTALAKNKGGKTPEQLRAEAQALLDKARLQEEAQAAAAAKVAEAEAQKVAAEGQNGTSEAAQEAAPV